MRTAPNLFLPFLLGALPAQTSFILPSKAAARIGNSYNNYTFNYGSSYQPVHQQFLYNMADVPVPAGALRGIGFRRPNSMRDANPAATATVSVRLSVGPNDSHYISTTFANNLGTTVVPVFQGNLNLPPAAQSTGVPPTMVVIPFAQAFPFLKSMGPGLVVDIATTVYSPISANATWFIDASGLGVGQRDTNWSASGCRFSNNNYNNSISHMNPVLGSIWYVNYNNILPNAPGVGAVGFRGAGMSWGPIVLPFSLAAFGAPGCSWAVSMELTYPLQADSSGSAPGIRLSIPNDPVLDGAAFYDHPLFLDPAANSLGIVLGWSSKWIIGSGALPEGAMILKYRDTTVPSPTGSKITTVPVIEFFI